MVGNLSAFLGKINGAAHKKGILYGCPEK